MENVSFFQHNQNVCTASAPGRMDVMGGIADYSGSLVLQTPIRERATVQVAFREDGLLRIYSATIGQAFEMAASAVPDDYDAARHYFNTTEGGDWAAYILGCLLVLKKEKGISVSRGIDFKVTSEVPVGKGVSSSAALEMATMMALAQLYRLNFQGTEIAVLAQKAENLVVGAPCGLMDQLASCFGRSGYLLPIRCQPDQLLELIKIPGGVSFAGLDSGVRHAVSGASYSDVRTAAFMGYSMIARAEGCEAAVISATRRTGSRSGLPYNGYLCNIPVSIFQEKYETLLPETMSGADFLKNFGETIDPITQVRPETLYAVRNCTQHPVFENDRVEQFAASMKQPPTLESLLHAGQLMYAAHESYSACGLGNPSTDELVERVKRAGPETGVFGAKITGGGSGGTVCVLCKGAEGLATVGDIFQDYQSRRGGLLNIIYS